MKTPDEVSVFQKMAYLIIDLPKGVAGI